jgi:ornithine carbamoyltransferase
MYELVRSGGKIPDQGDSNRSRSYRADPVLLAKMRSGAAGENNVSGDMDSVSPDTDLIYTDCWPKSEIPAEKDRIEKLFLPYQVTGEIVLD